MSRERMGAVCRYGLTLAAIGLIWLIFGSGWMLALMLVLVIPVPVSLAVGACVGRKIRCQLRLPTTASKNVPWESRVMLENPTAFSVEKLEIRLKIVNDLTGDENFLSLFGALAPGETGNWRFELESGHCGRVYIQVECARIVDIFGVFSVKIPVKSGARVTILPDLFSCEIAAEQAFVPSDEGTASRRGDDRTEVFQLREYRYGDDIRQIHWKLSAKTGEMILREGSQSISRELLVYWDKREKCTAQAMDAMAEVTASVCQALCEDGIRFDLAWTEAEEIFVREIGGMDDLLASIPALVTRAGMLQCPDPDMTGYSRVVRIGQIDESGGKLGLTTMDPQGENGSEILFSPDDYRKKLERLEI